MPTIKIQIKVCHYAKYFIEKLRETEPFRFKIKTKVRDYNEKGIMIGVCNSRKYGTGIPLNLEGDPTDGKFEIVVIKNINPASLLKSRFIKIWWEFSR